MQQKGIGLYLGRTWNMNKDITELSTLFVGRQMVVPDVKCELMRSEYVELIKAIGLPKRFSGWFHAPAVVRPCVDYVGKQFIYEGTSRNLGEGCSIIHSVVTDLVVERDSGFAVLVGLNGKTEFMNSSLYQMLYCIGCFWMSSDSGFADVSEQLERCKRIDAAAFADPQNGWNIDFKEAAEGMY